MPRGVASLHEWWSRTEMFVPKLVIPYRRRRNPQWNPGGGHAKLVEVDVGASRLMRISKISYIKLINFKY